MSSSLEVIRSWKNYCFWPYHPDNSFSYRGILSGGIIVLYSVPFINMKCNPNCIAFEVGARKCRRMVYITLMLATSNLLKVQDNNDVLAYWLSNSSTLLLLLQHTLKASGAASLTPQRRRTTSASLFGRMSQVRSNSFPINKFLIFFSGEGGFLGLGGWGRFPL